MSEGVFPCILNLDTRLDETEWPASPSGHVTSGQIALGTRLVGPHVFLMLSTRENSLVAKTVTYD